MTKCQSTNEDKTVATKLPQLRDPTPTNATPEATVTWRKLYSWLLDIFAAPDGSIHVQYFNRKQLEPVFGLARPRFTGHELKNSFEVPEAPRLLGISPRDASLYFLQPDNDTERVTWSVGRYSPLIATAALVLLSTLLAGFRPAGQREYTPVAVSALPLRAEDLPMVSMQWVLRPEDLICCETAAPAMRRAARWYREWLRITTYLIGRDTALARSFLRRERLGTVALVGISGREFARSQGLQPRI